MRTLLLFTLVACASEPTTPEIVTCAAEWNRFGSTQCEAACQRMPTTQISCAIELFEGEPPVSGMYLGQTVDGVDGCCVQDPNGSGIVRFYECTE